VPGRASSVKMVGMAEMGAPISQDGMAVYPHCWCICLRYLHFAPENPEDGKQRYDIWVSSHGHSPHAYANRRWENPAGTQHKPVLGCIMQGCVNDDLRADGLWKGTWNVGTWNVDSLTGIAGELVKALSGRKVDVACIQETRWKGSGCKLYGAKGKRYKLFRMGGEERLVGVGTFAAEIWGCTVLLLSKGTVKEY